MGTDAPTKSKGRTRTHCDCGLPATVVRDGTMVCNRRAKIDGKNYDPPVRPQARYGGDYYTFSAHKDFTGQSH